MAEAPAVLEGITVTDQAAEQVRQVREQSNLPETAGLRVGVKGGGCSGLTYVLDFDSEPRQGEKVYEHNGIRLFIDLKSYLYLRGTELDFSGGLNGKGFTFSNPNASRTCGCGTSFSV
jgi:iron-sulfur cluster assembly protein